MQAGIGAMNCQTEDMTLTPKSWILMGYWTWDANFSTGTTAKKPSIFSTRSSKKKKVCHGAPTRKRFGIVSILDQII